MDIYLLIIPIHFLSLYYSEVDFYNQFKKYLFSKILKEKDIIMLVHGGHGFKILKDVEMIEIKQGPYNLIRDKIKFDNIGDNKIKLK